MNGIEPEECFHTVQIRIGRGGRSQVKCKPFCTHFSYRNEIQKPNSKTKTQLNSKSKKKKNERKKNDSGMLGRMLIILSDETSWPIALSSRGITAFLHHFGPRTIHPFPESRPESIKNIHTIFLFFVVLVLNSIYSYTHTYIYIYIYIYLYNEMKSY